MREGYFDHDPLKHPDYGVDVPYTRGFVKQVAPAWLDHVALIAGIEPPARQSGFSWCDLGCGQGVTATILAATHPQGYFSGIDAMPSHIEHARRFAEECAVNNATFYAFSFEEATKASFECFDYIVCHGVYSWIDDRSKATLRQFVDRRLKPGGLLFISYYAIPGRAADLSFQRLVRALGRMLPGDSATACAAAIDIVDKFIEAKAPALVASPLAFLSKTRPEIRSHMAHDLMVTSWNPLCVTEVRADMTSIGLDPVGSANLLENYDTLMLTAAQRELLTSIADANTRELARDYLINQFFRFDVFVRDGRRLHKEERHERLLNSTFALARPPAFIQYSVTTDAGQLNFDNAMARDMVASFASGPMRLIDLASGVGIDPQGVLATGLLLAATDVLQPVESARAEVRKVNDAIRQRLGGPEEIPYLVLPSGVTLKIDKLLRGILWEYAGGELDKVNAWKAFLRVCGV